MREWVRYVEFHGPDGEKIDVEVSGDAGVELGSVLESRIFLDWIDACEDDPDLFITKIHIQSVDMFGKRVGFVKLISDAKARSSAECSEGSNELVSVPGIVFLRGASVAILVVLICKGKEYTLLAYQPRVPAGECHYSNLDSFQHHQARFYAAVEVAAAIMAAAYDACGINRPF